MHELAARSNNHGIGLVDHLPVLKQGDVIPAPVALRHGGRALRYRLGLELGRLVAHSCTQRTTLVTRAVLRRGFLGQ